MTKLLLSLPASIAMNFIMFRRLLCAAILITLGAPVSRAGFSEPPITYYGTVTKQYGRKFRPVEGGKMTWTIEPSGGQAFVLQSELVPLPGGFSYRLEVPVEKLVRTGEVSAGAVNATKSKSTFRVSIVISGKEAIVVSGKDELHFSEGQRGKLAQVDLRVIESFQDTDGDGLPDWWEDEYAALGFDKFNANDAAGDMNGDGISNLEEFRAGNDPGRAFITYPEWAASHELTGPGAAEGADFDQDGELNIVEFGLDTNPRLADRALIQQRVSAAAVVDRRSTYLQMTCKVPVIQRRGIRYVIEASTNLTSWRRIFDSPEAFGTLIKRDPVRVQASSTKQRFMRLRIVSANAPDLLADAGIWGVREQAVPRKRGVHDGAVLLAAPFEPAVAGQGEVATFDAAIITDLSSAWAARQWTTTPHLLTFTSGTARGQTFLITGQSGKTLSLETGAVDLASALNAGDRYDIRPAPTIAGTFGNPPRSLRIGVGSAADLVQLGNGTGFDEFSHDGTGWIQTGQAGERGETSIFPGEGFFVRNRGSRAAQLRFTGLLPRDRRVIGLSANETLAGSGSVLPRTLLASGFAAIPGWTQSDAVELWTGRAFKRYFYDGTHWRTGTSRASQNRLRIRGGAAIRITRTAGGAAILWPQVNP